MLAPSLSKFECFHILVTRNRNLPLQSHRLHVSTKWDGSLLSPGITTTDCREIGLIFFPATNQRSWKDDSVAVPGSIALLGSPHQLIRRCSTRKLTRNFPKSPFWRARSSVAEQPAFNRQVAGSIPAGPTTPQAPYYEKGSGDGCRNSYQAIMPQLRPRGQVLRSRRLVCDNCGGHRRPVPPTPVAVPPWWVPA